MTHVPTKDKDTSAPAPIRSGGSRIVWIAFAVGISASFMPHLLRLLWNIDFSLNYVSQFLAYAGGLLFGVEALGRERTDRIDQRISVLLRNLLSDICAFILAFFFIQTDWQRRYPKFFQTDSGDVREQVTVYVFAFLDLSIWVVFFLFLAPYLVKEARVLSKETLLAAVPWCFFGSFIVMFVIGQLMIFVSFRRKRFLSSCLYGLFLVVSGVALFFNGWIIVPWLVGLVLILLLARPLLGLLELKEKFGLGSVFSLLGLLCLSMSALFFLLQDT
jgi:hypothetical protein